MVSRISFFQPPIGAYPDSTFFERLPQILEEGQVPNRNDIQTLAHYLLQNYRSRITPENLAVLETVIDPARPAGGDLLREAQWRIVQFELYRIYNQTREGTNVTIINWIRNRLINHPIRVPVRNEPTHTHTYDTAQPPIDPSTRREPPSIAARPSPPTPPIPANHPIPADTPLDRNILPRNLEELINLMNRNGLENLMRLAREEIGNPSLREFQLRFRLRTNDRINTPEIVPIGDNTDARDRTSLNIYEDNHGNFQIRQISGSNCLTIIDRIRGHHGEGIEIWPNWLLIRNARALDANTTYQNFRELNERHLDHLLAFEGRNFQDENGRGREIAIAYRAINDEHISTIRTNFTRYVRSGSTVVYIRRYESGYYRVIEGNTLAAQGAQALRESEAIAGRLLLDPTTIPERRRIVYFQPTTIEDFGRMTQGHLEEFLRRVNNRHPRSPTNELVLEFDTAGNTNLISSFEVKHPDEANKTPGIAQLRFRRLEDGSFALCEVRGNHGIRAMREIRSTSTPDRRVLVWPNWIILNQEQIHASRTLLGESGATTLTNLRNLNREQMEYLAQRFGQDQASENHRYRVLDLEFYHNTYPDRDSIGLMYFNSNPDRHQERLVSIRLKINFELGTIVFYPIKNENYALPVIAELQRSPAFSDFRVRIDNSLLRRTALNENGIFIPNRKASLEEAFSITNLNRYLEETRRMSGESDLRSFHIIFQTDPRADGIYNFRIGYGQIDHYGNDESVVHIRKNNDGSFSICQFQGRYSNFREIHEAIRNDRIARVNTWPDWLIFRNKTQNVNRHATFEDFRKITPAQIQFIIDRYGEEIGTEGKRGVIIGFSPPRKSDISVFGPIHFYPPTKTEFSRDCRAILVTIEPGSKLITQALTSHNELPQRMQALSHLEGNLDSVRTTEENPNRGSHASSGEVEQVAISDDQIKEILDRLRSADNRPSGWAVLRMCDYLLAYGNLNTEDTRFLERVSQRTPSEIVGSTINRVMEIARRTTLQSGQSFGEYVEERHQSTESDRPPLPRRAPPRRTRRTPGQDGFVDISILLKPLLFPFRISYDIADRIFGLPEADRNLLADRINSFAHHVRASLGHLANEIDFNALMTELFLNSKRGQIFTLTATDHQGKRHTYRGTYSEIRDDLFLAHQRGWKVESSSPLLQLSLKSPDICRKLRTLFMSELLGEPMVMRTMIGKATFGGINFVFAEMASAVLVGDLDKLSALHAVKTFFIMGNAGAVARGYLEEAFHIYEGRYLAQHGKKAYAKTMNSQNYLFAKHQALRLFSTLLGLIYMDCIDRGDFNVIQSAGQIATLFIPAHLVTAGIMKILCTVIKGLRIQSGIGLIVSTVIDFTVFKLGAKGYALYDEYQETEQRLDQLDKSLVHLRDNKPISARDVLTINITSDSIDDIQANHTDVYQTLVEIDALLTKVRPDSPRFNLLVTLRRVKYLQSQNDPSLSGEIALAQDDAYYRMNLFLRVSAQYNKLYKKFIEHIEDLYEDGEYRKALVLQKKFGEMIIQFDRVCFKYAYDVEDEKFLAARAKIRLDELYGAYQRELDKLRQDEELRLRDNPEDFHDLVARILFHLEPDSFAYHHALYLMKKSDPLLSPHEIREQIFDRRRVNVLDTSALLNMMTWEEEVLQRQISDLRRHIAQHRQSMRDNENDAAILAAAEERLRDRIATNGRIVRRNFHARKYIGGHSRDLNKGLALLGKNRDDIIGFDIPDHINRDTLMDLKPETRDAFLSLLHEMASSKKPQSDNPFLTQLIDEEFIQDVIKD